MGGLRSELLPLSIYPTVGFSPGFGSQLTDPFLSSQSLDSLTSLSTVKTTGLDTRTKTSLCLQDDYKVEDHPDAGHPKLHGAGGAQLQADADLPDVPRQHGVLQGQGQDAAGGGGECSVGSSQVRSDSVL